jgi:hypothetical protein
MVVMFYLPPAIAKLVASARLPKNYQEAKKVIAKCDRIDECAEWSNKAAAIASYARQADDPELENYARRIRARASRRAGELLREFDGRGGDRRSKAQTPPNFDRPARLVIAERAGMTEHKARTAIRIAAIPEDEFEAAIEAAPVPGTTLLAKLSKRPPPNEVKTLTAEHLYDLSARHRAKEVIDGLLRLGWLGKQGWFDPEYVVALLSEPENSSKVAQVHEGIGLALRVKNTLEKAGLRATPTLRSL